MFKTLTIGLVCLAAAAPGLAENLYREGQFQAPASDPRAHRAGDPVTVLVYEASSASAQADGNLRRNSELGIQASADGHGYRASVGAGSRHDSGGAVQRSGRLLGQITATVLRVEGNGDLWIGGQQDVTINADRILLKVEGRVRAHDIGAANTVLSSRLAQARISYLASGPLEEARKPGLLARLSAWLGL